MSHFRIKVIYLLTALCVFAGCGSQQLIPRTVRFTPAPNGEVKVMTFNIRTNTLIDGFHRWKQRKQLVVDTIKSNASDIIGLQEAEMDQVRLIQSAMPQYSQYAAGRKNGRQKGETCAIFFRKSRFSKLDSGTFWFSNTPADPGSKDWGNWWPRICSWVRLLDNNTRTAFYVYNVHLDNVSQHSREMSVRLLVGKIAARKNRDPFIVMGDFNMSHDNSAMQYMQKIGYQHPYPRIVDIWTSVNFRKPRIGTRHKFRGRISGPMIDHIQLCENIIPLEVKVDRRHYQGKYPSDHFPVTAKVLIKRPTQVTYRDTDKPKHGASIKSSKSGGV